MLRKLWLQSQTKVVAYTQALSGGVLFTLSQINGWINNDTMKGYLAELDLPKSITIGLVVLGIVTYVAHGHGDDA